jgi:hypothetical protein
MFGIILQLSTWGAVLAIPVALYEMTLAVWLIVKGFSMEEGLTEQGGVNALAEASSVDRITDAGSFISSGT